MLDVTVIYSRYLYYDLGDEADFITLDIKDRRVV